MRILVLYCLLGVPACVGTSHECENNPGLRVLSSDLGDQDYVDSDTTSSEIVLAVGGTERFHAIDDECDDSMPATDIAATSDTPTVASVTVGGSVFDVKGLAEGPASGPISAAGWRTSWFVEVVPIDHIVLVAQELGEPDAFYAGAGSATIKVFDVHGRVVVDRDLSVVSDTFQRGDAWNHLAIGNAAPGHYSFAINAGDRAWPVDMTLVDHITGVTPNQSNVVGIANEGKDVCFFAHLDGALVAGVPWQFGFDPHWGKVSPTRANCVTVTDAAGTMHFVSAQALGFSASATVQFD